MLKRKIKITSEIEPGGEIGEIKQDGEHTYINRIKLNLRVFKIDSYIESVPDPLVRYVRMDGAELEKFLIFNMRDSKIFYRALDCLSETERNKILMGYVNREKG